MNIDIELIGEREMTELIKHAAAGFTAILIVAVSWSAIFTVPGVIAMPILA